MPISHFMLQSVPQFTRAPDPFTLGTFALITILAMVCWTVNTTDSDDRAEVVRAFTEMVRVVFDGVKSLLTWPGSPGEEPPDPVA